MASSKGMEKKQSMLIVLSGSGSSCFALGDLHYFVQLRHCRPEPFTAQRFSRYGSCYDRDCRIVRTAESRNLHAQAHYFTPTTLSARSLWRLAPHEQGCIDCNGIDRTLSSVIHLTRLSFARPESIVQYFFPIFRLGQGGLRLPFGGFQLDWVKQSPWQYRRNKPF